MSYDQNQATQRAPLMQRLNNFKRNHLVALFEMLCENETTVSGEKIDPVSYNLNAISDNSIRFDIRQNWDEPQILRQHNRLTAQYRSGERYYKKGRPFGAKNRVSRDNSIPSYLDDMNDFNDVPSDGDNQSIDALRELGFEEDTKSQPVKYAATPNAPNAIDETQIRKIIAGQFADFINAYKSDKDNNIAQIERALKESLTLFEASMNVKFEQLKPNVIEIQRGDALPTLNLGVQHKHFEKLLRMCSAVHRNGAHNNVWIYGPAGTGKSTAAEKVAEALGLDYYTDGKMADETKVLGYQDANGVYRTTNFRKAFEFGGVYLADEIDGSMPDALLALNGALANGHCSFPDRIVKRHKDFIFLAAANTTGTGGTVEYVGRFKQDAAFNDRFCFLDWPLDDSLEDSLCANKDWLKYVRHVRARLSASSIKGHLITPRATIYGETLLAAGCDLEDVKRSVLQKGLTQTQWDMVK